MKYYSLIILFVFAVTFSMEAQNNVGIGTTNPQSTFHIDANKNTSGSSNTADDVIVNTSGNVGIGKISPTEKLHINGNTLITGNDSVTGNVDVVNNYITNNIKYGNTLSASPKAKLDIEAASANTGLRIANGTQTGKTIPVLTVDGSNNAIWKELPQITSIAKGIVAVDRRILNTNATTYYPITSQNLTIPAGGGLWLIYAKVIIGNYRGTSSVGTLGTVQRDVFMYLRESSTILTSTMVYPETTGSCIGILQLTHIYDAGPSTATAKTLDLAVRSDHFETANVPSNPNTTAQWNITHRAFRIYGNATDGSNYWTDPLFFAIRIDHKN